MSSDEKPFRSLERRFEQMQRQLEEVLDAWDGDRYGPTTELATTGMGIDLADRGDEFVLTADVPGFETDDIDLRLADDDTSTSPRNERRNRPKKTTSHTSGTSGHGDR